MPMSHKDFLKLVRPGALAMFFSPKIKHKGGKVKSAKNVTEFGKAIRKARIDAGTTLESMANEIGVNQSFLSNVETGRKKIPDSLIDKIEAYFIQFGITSLNLRKLASISNGVVDISDLSLDQQSLIVKLASRQLSVKLLSKIAGILDLTYL